MGDSVRQLSRLDESLVPKYLAVDDAVSSDDGQPPLSDEDILANLLGNIEGDQVEVDGDSDLSGETEKPSSAQVRGAIDDLMNLEMLDKEK